MLTTDNYYQPPIINTYQVTAEMRTWRVLDAIEQKTVYQKRALAAVVTTALWAAVAVAIYFLATTSHGTTPNSVFISIVVVGAGGISVFTVAFGIPIPVLKTPKFEEPGVSEAILFHLTQSKIEVLCQYLEGNGGVSSLVQRGFLLPDQGEVLADYMAEKSKKTPTQLEHYRSQWEQGVQPTICLKYAEDVTLKQFIEGEGFGGVSRSSRVASGGGLDRLLKTYNASKRIVEGFEARLSEEDAKNFDQYQLAKEEFEKLEYDWRQFKECTIPNFLALKDRSIV